ncbi:hypothetical protein IE077_000689, partial [Cardiosporidium cionae]
MMKYEYIDKMAASTENHINISGIVGICNLLQSGVSSTFKILREAGIRLWMVTGDDSECAKAVAYNSGMISTKFYVDSFQLPTTREGVYRYLETFLKRIVKNHPKKSISVAVTGHDLQILLMEEY